MIFKLRVIFIFPDDEYSAGPTISEQNVKRAAFPCGSWLCHHCRCLIKPGCADSSPTLLWGGFALLSTPCVRYVPEAGGCPCLQL